MRAENEHADKEISRQIDLNESTIKEAHNMMDKMAALRSRLHIRDGAGQRYLQKLKPEHALLKQAEREIISQYANASGSSAPTSGKKSKLLRNTAKRNTI